MYCSTVLFVMFHWSTTVLSVMSTLSAFKYCAKGYRSTRKYEYRHYVLTRCLERLRACACCTSIIPGTGRRQARSLLALDRGHEPCDRSSTHFSVPSHMSRFPPPTSNLQPPSLSWTLLRENCSRIVDCSAAVVQ